MQSKQNYETIGRGATAAAERSSNIMEFRTLSEKVAYLKGLMEGLDRDDKVIALMSDILFDMAKEIEKVKNNLEEISEVVDTIDEDLGEIEKDFYEIDEDECGCGRHHLDEIEYDDEDEDDDFDDEDLDDLFDEEEYEVVCPNCSNTIVLNEAMIEEGSISCPNCNMLLEFDFDDEVEESAGSEDNE